MGQELYNKEPEKKKFKAYYKFEIFINVKYNGQYMILGTHMTETKL